MGNSGVATYTPPQPFTMPAGLATGEYSIGVGPWTANTAVQNVSTNDELWIYYGAFVIAAAVGSLEVFVGSTNAIVYVTPVTAPGAVANFSAVPLWVPAGGWSAVNVAGTGSTLTPLGLSIQRI